MAPKRPPKATPKLDQKWIQNGIQFWAALGPILGSILGPKTDRPGGHIFQCFSVKSRPRSKHSSFSCFPVCVFFVFFVIFKTLFGSKNANSPVPEACFAPRLGAPKNCFFSRFSGLLFWLHVGSVLAPSWPHPGLSWPLLAHLGPCWPHLGVVFFLLLREILARSSRPF